MIENRDKNDKKIVTKIFPGMALFFCCLLNLFFFCFNFYFRFLHDYMMYFHSAKIEIHVPCFILQIYYDVSKNNYCNKIVMLYSYLMYAFKLFLLIVLKFLSTTGHGPAINENSIDKIDEYITNRLKREEDILSFLQNVFLQNKFRDQNYGNCSVQNTAIKSKISETEKTHKLVKESTMPNMKSFFRNENYKSSWEIMSKIYGKLPVFVKFSAQSNCLHHLKKLLKENKVSHKWPDLWAINTHK